MRFDVLDLHAGHPYILGVVHITLLYYKGPVVEAH